MMTPEQQKELLYMFKDLLESAEKDEGFFEKANAFLKSLNDPRLMQYEAYEAHFDGGGLGFVEWLSLTERGETPWVPEKK
ncbi:MAG: hypothetical protein AAGA46_00460 [Cyanobacteria bacterium P01_F01_bin.13]